MADKDTRDDFEMRGEPVLPLPDGPRSEGGPPRVTAPDADEPVAASRPDIPDEVGGSVAEAVPAAELRPGPEEPAPEAPAMPEPDHPSLAPSPAEAGAGAVSQAFDGCPAEPATSWHDAIAEALAEARGGEEAPSPPAQPASPAAAAPPAADPETQAPPAAAFEAAPDAAAAPAPEDEAAFTAAAQDLFRPPVSAAVEEPHLITIGRRLDPGRIVPRPTAPVITPPYEPEPPRRVTWAEGTWRDRLRIAARYAAYAAAGYLILVLVLILIFRFVNPPGSMLMLTRLLGGTAVNRTWVPFSAISPALARAVIVSEDSRFCAHGGIDTDAMREAIERAGRGTPRGASTISMQVVKNLFLWNAKSYVRKVIEIPLTLFMEFVWPKQRILEVYLNIAEWGPGVFGAEAAARHHFNKPAARLSEREAALLAAVLPNPVVRDAGQPGPGTSAKARVVQSRVRAYGAIASCVVSAAAPAAVPSDRTPAVRAPGVRRTPIRPVRPPARNKQPEAWAPIINLGTP